MPATYESIATTTTTSGQSSVTFTSITSAFTDLIIVVNGTQSSNYDVYLEFNGGGGTYSRTFLTEGTGESPSGGRSSSQSKALLGSISASGRGINYVNIFDYSNTTTYKNILNYAMSAGTSGDSNGRVSLMSNQGASTNAITSIVVGADSPSTFNSGVVISLYGIKAAS
jgi:hypothetical protein